ncbi:MAG: hypothetical protein IVW55_05660 [Chloroflexi bacterium]|nr:hypothetical protein [Chloroflexota bacterium]
MELRQYWNVIRKRWWLVAVIVGLVAVASALIFLRTNTTYQSEVRFITRQSPSPDNPSNPGSPGSMVFTFDRYYNWFGSEFLVDDYTEIVGSDAFAQSVMSIMSGTLTLGKGQGQLTLDDIKNALQADRKQRILRIIVTGASRDESVALAKAASTVLVDARLKPLNNSPMVDDRAVFTQIDQATPDAAKSSKGKDLINAIVRVIIGLVAALALVFLLEYLDSSIRDERDAEKVLDLPVIGAIPHT